MKIIEGSKGTILKIIGSEMDFSIMLCDSITYHSPGLIKYLYTPQYNKWQVFAISYNAKKTGINFYVILININRVF